MISWMVCLKNTLSLFLSHQYFIYENKSLYHFVDLLAERKTSLGKNWHPNCLKCEECGKILSPGQHAEVKK